MSAASPDARPCADPILTAFSDEFRRLKRSADRGLAQLDHPDFFFKLSAEQNSIFAILKHMAGNMHSRWTDFLTTDGDKPDRDREAEFVDDPTMPRDKILHMWEDGWDVLFRTLAAMHDADLLRTVTIRGEAMTAAAAITRQVAHYGWHVGQIVLLAKHIRGERWNYVTIAPGKSAEYKPR